MVLDGDDLPFRRCGEGQNRLGAILRPDLDERPLAGLCSTQPLRNSTDLPAARQPCGEGLGHARQGQGRWQGTAYVLKATVGKCGLASGLMPWRMTKPR